MGFAHTSRRVVERLLLQFLDGAAVVDQRQMIKAFEGYKFTAGYRFEGVASDAQVNVLLRVPTGAGRRVFFAAFEVSSYAQAHVDVYFDVEYSGGSKLEAVNLRRSSGIASKAEVLRSVSFTPSIHHLPLVHPGGVKQFATGGLSELSGAAILDPGSNILIAVTNKSTSSQDISLRLTWWEEPTS
ncbi:MAG: hypothetical protein JRD89_15275 [Deltaproteobacteria bacterium]|nr:hypothetical protein [Deltaproteobacteria bacterium]